MTSNKTIFTKNSAHLGDCIFSCVFFNKIKKYIEDNNVIFYFYCESDHYKQVIEFKTSNNVIIKTLSEIPNEETIHDLWIGSQEYNFNWFNSNDPYDVFLAKFYNGVLEKLNIPVTINDFLIEDEDLLNRNKSINEKTNNKYANIDFLINNGAPRSGQFGYDLEEWNKFIIMLNEKHNVITTQKVDGVKCTRDDNLSAKDIASISIYAKTIIAIDSGVAAGLFNVYTIKNVNKIYYLCNASQRCDCSFPNFVKRSSLSELQFLLNEEKESFSNIEIDYSAYYMCLFLLIVLFILMLKRALSFKKFKLNSYIYI